MALFSTAAGILLAVSALGGGDRMPKPPSAKQAAQVVLAELNHWDRDEIDLAESPQKHPGEKPSGETNGWIEAHQQKLQALGYEARWNRRTRVFVLHRLPIKGQPGSQ